MPKLQLLVVARHVEPAPKKRFSAEPMCSRYEDEYYDSCLGGIWILLHTNWSIIKFFGTTRYLQSLSCNLHTLGLPVGIVWMWMCSSSDFFSLSYQVISQSNSLTFMEYSWGWPTYFVESMIIVCFPKTPHNGENRIHYSQSWIMFHQSGNLQMDSSTSRGKCILDRNLKQTKQPWQSYTQKTTENSF